MNFSTNGTLTTLFGDLLPCPKCGARPRLKDWSTWWVECERGCEHPAPPREVSQSATKVVAWWNERAVVEQQAPCCPVHPDVRMVYADGTRGYHDSDAPAWRCELWVGGGVCGATRPLADADAKEGA